MPRGEHVNRKTTVDSKTELVKELRARTGAGVMDCRTAVEQAGGDLEKAVELLRAKGLATALKKASREASEGLVEAYVHAGGRVGGGQLPDRLCGADGGVQTTRARHGPAGDRRGAPVCEPRGDPTGSGGEAASGVCPRTCGQTRGSGGRPS